MEAKIGGPMRKRKFRIDTALKETVRTYVNHVKNVCHLELVYSLTKHTLLVIG